MRTVFFGTPDIAVPSLAAVAAKHEVTAVVCQPDKPQGRNLKLTPPPVKVWALKHGIPVHQPLKLNDGAFEQWLREQTPELCTMAAYGRLLKQPILDVPPLGWLNLHPSLLPRWRGPSPIQTAILEGDADTGVTIMRVTLEMDSGDILLQQSTPIGPEETAEALSERLGVLGAARLVQGMELVENGSAEFTPQDPAKAAYCVLFEKEHGRIRWAQPAAAIDRLIRAAIPWPMAHCLYKGEICRIHKARPVDTPCDALPGTIVAVEKDCILVATGQGLLAVLMFQAPGKKAMPMLDFLRGRKMMPGERLEDIV